MGIGAATALETIDAAAIRYKGVIHTLPRPARHADIIHQLHAEGGLEDEPVRGRDQGFVTSRGRFVNRSEAARIAIRAGQTQKLNFQPGLLFSEDLW